MSISLDEALGLGWVKWLAGVILIAVSVLLVVNWYRSNLDGAEQRGVDKTENAALKENANDAKKLIDQKDAIDNGPSLIDSVLPIQPKETDNSKDRQNNIEDSNPEDAITYFEDFPRIEGDYRVGTDSELPSRSVFWRSATELLPEADCTKGYSVNPITNEIEKGCY